MPILIWSLKEIVEVIKFRQANKFDANIGVSGARGNGKSTLIFKLLSRLDNFKPWVHQVYSREDVMRLLEKQKFGIVFDDEAINSGYKRDFYEQGQKKLIKMINMYRDNFNVYASAIPRFYSLDKDLRELIKIHLHVISRGLAVIHVAKDGNLYSNDPWDVDYNKKIEQSFTKRSIKNPNATMPYHKLSTFQGFLRFGDLRSKQRDLYETIKATKRKIIYEKELKEGVIITEEKSPIDKVYEMLKEARLTRKELKKYCVLNGWRYYNVLAKLNHHLVNEGLSGGTKELFDRAESSEDSSKLLTIKNQKNYKRPLI